MSAPVLLSLIYVDSELSEWKTKKMKMNFPTCHFLTHLLYHFTTDNNAKSIPGMSEADTEVQKAILQLRRQYCQATPKLKLHLHDERTLKTET